MFEGVVGADPTVRPGWEKGSESLDCLPQRLPIVVRYDEGRWGGKVELMRVAASASL